MHARDIGLYAILVFAMGALSSAAAAFEQITSVSPFMKACWRLEVTAILQIVPMVYEIRKDLAAVKTMIVDCWHYLLVSGLCLGLTFSLWCWSLDLTSIAHSLLFSCSAPLVVVVAYFVLCKKVAPLEIVGVVIGFVGLTVVIFGNSESEGSTWYGDVIAFMTAITLAVYMLIGKKLMEKSVPMWTYLTIANIEAAIWAYIFAVAVQGDDPIEGIQWIYTSDWLIVIYLGLVPGALGHGAINWLLKFMSCLVISVFINFEPVIGSFIGWVVGIQPPPAIYTYIGGAIVMAGNLTVTYAGSKVKVEGDTEEKFYLDEEKRKTEEMRESLLDDDNNDEGEKFERRISRKHSFALA
ncbi:unnamed protein product [Blepharisma stoltei]|uniref:EamA domain-containing protein n=1 Tax=Blepharisma stoltei TaxID=1481888 RepID=A0AAU9IX54_9CILI|nr:unnamed protein product [Blepharisma stoltei]